jgi:hypothetical protein
VSAIPTGRALRTRLSVRKEARKAVLLPTPKHLPYSSACYQFATTSVCSQKNTILIGSGRLVISRRRAGRSMEDA